jgi:hypothetical protein
VGRHQRGDVASYWDHIRTFYSNYQSEAVHGFKWASMYIMKEQSKIFASIVLQN